VDIPLRRSSSTTRSTGSLKRFQVSKSGLFSFDTHIWTHDGAAFSNSLDCHHVKFAAWHSPLTRLPSYRQDAGRSKRPRLGGDACTVTRRAADR
jgi:hypothetical protein